MGDLYPDMTLHQLRELNRSMVRDIVALKLTFDASNYETCMLSMMGQQSAMLMMIIRILEEK